MSRREKREMKAAKQKRLLVIALISLALLAVLSFLLFEELGKNKNNNPKNETVTAEVEKTEVTVAEKEKTSERVDFNNIASKIGNAKPELEKIEIDNAKVVLYFSKRVSCSIDGETYSEKDKTFEFAKAQNVDIVYIASDNERDETITKIEVGKYIRLFDKTSDSIFIALGAVEDINYLLKEIDNYEIIVADTEMITVTGTKIAGNQLGSTFITIKTPVTSIKFTVVVTNLISVKGNSFDYDKPYLSANIYSKEDNDKLDEILVSRVNRGGYQTRAGVVEAARFITMEFPYRINYFSENGRLADYPKADGEGRFYHKGLYLHPSRCAVIDPDYIVNGPNPWGYEIYSNPAGGMRKNGLDCSGLISWIIYQGGYDPTDMGAGVDSYRRDFTDLGPKEHITDAVMSKIKVGDLLSGDGEVTDAAGGGHIAMLIGIKDGYYYVAEELWGKPSLSHGAVAYKYSYSEFKYYFYWRVDMDEYYGQDGNLTQFWN